jgi:hypothetical protein
MVEAMVHIRLFFTLPAAWRLGVFFYVVWGRVSSSCFLWSPVCVAPIRFMAV